MDQSELDLLIQLHKDNERQGPGSPTDTALALAMCRLNPSEALKVADMGCGTGSVTLQLARSLNAHVTAVDISLPFLDKLQTMATKEGLDHLIETIQASIDDLPFNTEHFDLIWSEGAIYTIGFSKGLNDWRCFLKPGGYMAVSEMTWLSNVRDAEIERYWQEAYPEITTVSGNLEKISEAGYRPIGYFILPETSWIDHYYAPLQSGFDCFLKRNTTNPRAHEIVEAERAEIDLYHRHKQSYGYGFYVAQRPTHD